jgi:hypothetical protein
MANTKKSHSASKGTVEKLVAAATAFKESWNHIKKARAKAAPATGAISRTATRAGKATFRAAKRVMPSSKRSHRK